MKFYLSGQRTFANRGCEAIVRSTVETLRHTFGDVEILVPSDDLAHDSRHWPDAEGHGVTFVRAYTPAQQRLWAHAQRLPVPALKKTFWPFPFPEWVRDQISSVDAVLSVGGDNYSLDYRIPSLQIAIDRLAMDLGKKVYLWGASVGPFDTEPAIVPMVQQHLSKMSRILVRESISYDYLTGRMGLPNVEQMVDPAFSMATEPVDTAPFWPAVSRHGVFGLNISPLIERYAAAGQSIRDEVEGFIREAISEGFSVLLVPHVIPWTATSKRSDADYLLPLIERCSDLAQWVSITPRELTAPQIKHVVGKLRFFIGARTHATIAALSSGVPTASISYSVKARGINRDLFGDEWMVVPTPELSRSVLRRTLALLVEHEDSMKAHLSAAMPQYQRRIWAAAERLKDHVY